MHFVGCRGASMSHLMEIVKSQGVVVSGSDLLDGGHDAWFVDGADVVVYNSAIGVDNVELVRARELGVTLIERAELLGQIGRQYDAVIAVAGTHGKTSTTTMIGAILHSRRATVHVGGESVGVGGNFIGGKQFFVTEACEYRRNFLHLSPHVGVILNMELDHVDYYKDFYDLKSAYNSFASKCTHLVAHIDVASRLNKRSALVTFGESVDNVDTIKGDYTATNIVYDQHGTSFDCCLYGQVEHSIKLHCHGKHNVNNALASIAVGRTLGLSWDEIASGLELYRGVKRRFEIICSDNNGTLISDYAHHPSEITQCLNTAKSIYKNVRVIFQPHTYSRTKAFYKEFAIALSLADEVALAPIFAAREQDDGTNSQMIADLIPNSINLTENKDILEFINKPNVDGATIVMGAGDLDNLIR